MFVAVVAAVAFQAVGVRAAAPSTPRPPEKSAAELNGHPRDVSLSDTRHIDFVSKVNGHPYSIDVALPNVPPAPGGYPVIYVLDGYGYFASVTDAARTNGNFDQAIVVGIGYPRDPNWIQSVLDRHRPLPSSATDAPFDTAVDFERQYDLGLPVDDDYINFSRSIGKSVAAVDFGGVDDFLATIERDVKPRVSALAPVNTSDQTLFGHSLGGLTVLEALFTEPQAFHTFVAASPSIWWGNRAVLKKEAQFAAAISAGKTTPRVLITVGSDEDAMSALPPEYEAHRGAIEAFVKKSRMVGNACDLAMRLKALHGAKGYEVSDCAVFPGQNHGVSPWPAIGRAIAFARAKS
jgi:predicted alpha/beta superfamily hydrolase